MNFAAQEGATKLRGRERGSLNRLMNVILIHQPFFFNPVDAIGIVARLVMAVIEKPLHDLGLILIFCF